MKTKTTTYYHNRKTRKTIVDAVGMAAEVLARLELKLANVKADIPQESAKDVATVLMQLSCNLSMASCFLAEEFNIPRE
jgi:hypothetical protein